MKINPYKKFNFKGTYFLTSDNHSKPVNSISLFQKIEQEAHKKENCIYIDNGDFYTDLEPLMTDIYTTFAARNKNIQQIYNLGNAEFNIILNHPNYLSIFFNKLKNSGIKLICSPFSFIAEKLNINKEEYSAIQPYAIAKDDIEGKSEDVIILGTADIRNNEILTTEKQAQILFETIKKAQSETGIEKLILASHNSLEDTKKILDILNQKGINNIKLVAGGHSHKIEDETYKNTRILHPAPQAKSAYIVNSNTNGYDIQKIEYDRKNRYNYSSLETQNNKNIIPNLKANIQNINPQYCEIIKNTDLLDDITFCNFEIKNRESGFDVSYPSELGTMLANKLKEKTNADFAIVLSQDMRGELPKENRTIKRFEIYDVINADKKVWIIEANTKEIFDIFNVSLKAQHDNISNSDFLEYSNNILIKRYPNIPDEQVSAYNQDGLKQGKTKENRIKEIYIKEGNDWLPISEMQNETFKIATCSFVANAGRASLSYFKNINKKEEFSPALMTRDLFIEAYKEAQENFSPPKKSIMLDN